MKPKHLSALRKIYTELEGQPINWVITGSLGCALQGVKVEVHDIDIQTDRESALRYPTAVYCLTLDKSWGK
jgi:hypothetical protein